MTKQTTFLYSVNKYLRKFCGLIILSCSYYAHAQLYVLGNGTGKEVYADGVSGATPTIYVNGYISNQGGEIYNYGSDIELTGDWTNTPGAAGSYESTGIERFSGSSNQVVGGTMNGAIANINQFYNLKINKTAAGQTVSLSTNVNVNSSGTVQFQGNGIIRTDISSHGNNGSLYAYELYVRNISSTAITSYAVSGNNKYIEGILRRAVSGTNTYYFPVGVQSTFLDGEEPFSLSLTGASTSNILGYVQPGSITLIDTSMYCDAGTDPSPLTGTTILANPMSPADGILDKLKTNCQLSVEWKAIGSAASYDYDITSSPGTTLNSECVFYASTYLGALRFLANNAYPNNIGVTFPAPFLSAGHETCPNNYSISGISGSLNTVFRIHGIVDPSDAILPITLLTFKGETVNAGNLISWITETEHNNDYFTLETSYDAQNFEYLAKIDGAGNSTHELDYNFLDLNPLAATTYYRLTQVDFDGIVHYSNVIALSRITDNTLAVSPVPATDVLHVTYTAQIDSYGSVSIFALSGKKMISSVWQITSGSNLKDISINDLSAGPYFIEVNDGRKPIRTKFIKQ